MATTRILNKNDKVKIAFNRYIDTLKKTEERRELWKTETKNKLIDTLTLIQKSFKFDWRVQKLESDENYQTINIHCDSKNSGIVENKIDSSTGKVTGKKAYIKHGAYLAYCQSHNGRINVIIGFPYIDELVSKMDIKVIATIEPNQVSEDLISDHVIKFLNTISEWEGMDTPQIGFQMN